MIRLTLASMLLLVIPNFILFFLHNLDWGVTLRYCLGVEAASMFISIYTLVFSSFAVGLLVASIPLFPAWVGARIALRQENKALLELEAALERLRRPMVGVAPQSRSVAGRGRFGGLADE